MDPDSPHPDTYGEIGENETPFSVCFMTTVAFIYVYMAHFVYTGFP